MVSVPIVFPSMVRETHPTFRCAVRTLQLPNVRAHPTSYSAFDRPAPPLVSLIMAWAAAMRAMGMRMGEQDT